MKRGPDRRRRTDPAMLNRISLSFAVLAVGIALAACHGSTSVMTTPTPLSSFTPNPNIKHAVVQVTPKRHGWKKPLWTVHGTRLTYLVDGHTRSIVIHEMVAWRGAWYVTHLR